MMLLKMSGIKKSFGDKLLFSFEKLTIYEGERIGLTGLNGSGKTTLLRMINGECDADEGKIERYGTIQYFRQFDSIHQSADQKILKEFGVEKKRNQERVSGGEGTRIRLAETFSKDPHLLLMDEPTSNLDSEGICLLKEKLGKYASFILVSHDIELLNEFCTRIIEIREGSLYSYEGNYDAYKIQKEQELLLRQSEYERYVGEKKRLEAVCRKKSEKAKGMTKKPRNMSSSEYKMRNYVALSRSNEGRRKSMEKAAKAVQSRLDHLEKKEKPVREAKINIDFTLTNPPRNKIVIKGESLSFSYGVNEVFYKADFFIYNHSKTALTGNNGCGKTTLINLIKKGGEGIYLVPRAKPAFLHQEFDNLLPEETVLEAVMKDNIQGISTVRAVLSRLLFQNEDLQKKVRILSGGEKIRLSIAKMLVSDVNLLIFDEPANYLDLPSLEVLMEVIKEYEGTVLFVSHDRRFIQETATDILVIENRQIRMLQSVNPVS